MICIDCEHMACKQFLSKNERWTGYCMNPASNKYHTNVEGTDTCTMKPVELELNLDF